MNNPTKTLDVRSAVIGGLLVSAVALLLSLIFKPAPVVAAEVASSRDYQLVTAQVQNGGDALYVLDNRTGLVAFLSWDPNVKGIVPRDVRSLDQVSANLR